MTGILEHLHPIEQTLLATLFTWGLTALGAALVFVAKRLSTKVMNGMLGFAAGVMIAASFWSLLAPAIEMSESTNLPAWLPAAVGFLLGAFFLLGADKILPHLHMGFAKKEAEGLKTAWQRATLLVLAITLHNIPEGLAIGVAFGSVASDLPSVSLGGAVALSLGIGIQNFPEGLAVAMPLRREGVSRLRSFWFGQLSAVVEPVAGLIGVIAVLWVQSLLPYAFGFAAGAMIFVVVEEVIPEAQKEGNTDLPTIGAIVGFTVMMILDVALG